MVSSIQSNLAPLPGVVCSAVTTAVSDVVLAYHNVVPQTVRRQIALLRDLQAFVKQNKKQYNSASLTTCLLAFLDHKSKTGRRAWLPQTCFRNLLQLHAAFRYLPKFAHNCHVRIDLDH